MGTFDMLAEVEQCKVMGALLIIGHDTSSFLFDMETVTR